MVQLKALPEIEQSLLLHLQELTVENLANAIVDMMKKTGQTASEVVDAVLPYIWGRLDHGVVGGTTWKLLRTGLIFTCNGYTHNDRFRPEIVSYYPTEVEVRVSPNVTERIPIDIALTRIHYTGANNTFKPVIEFTVEDCQAAIKEAKTKELGHRRVRLAFEATERLLKLHRVQMVKMLSAKDKERILKRLQKIGSMED